MNVGTVASAINMITVINDDSRGVNYDRTNVTRVVPQFGASLLEASFTIVIFLNVFSTGTG
jgi:hypothetical protein